MKIIKIAMLSFGDIDNYGDLFFSKIFEDEIIKRLPHAKVDFFAPYGGLFSGIFYRQYNRRELSQYDAVIVAGGEIVHKKDIKTWAPIYEKRNMFLEHGHYSDIIWGWSDLNVKFKSFFSVGVLPIDDESLREELFSIINNVNFFSVRGILSKKIIENTLNYNKKIYLTPDLGWLFGKYINSLPIIHLEGADSNVLLEKNSYFIYQVNSVDDAEIKKIASQLNQFVSETHLKCVLLPVVKPWEDHKYLKKIYDEAKTNDIILYQYYDIYQTGKIILNARFVLCSSLHLAITALSDNIPAAIINKWPGTKLQDMCFHRFKTDYLSTEVDDIYSYCTRLLFRSDKQRQIEKNYCEYMQGELELAFDSLTILIKNS